MLPDAASRYRQSLIGPEADRSGLPQTGVRDRAPSMHHCSTGEPHGAFDRTAIGTYQDPGQVHVRLECLIYSGVVAAYRATQDSDHFLDLPKVLAHALEHDGIIGAWRDPQDGTTYHDSCRLFTDVGSALRFAKTQTQRSFYNLDRGQEVVVDEQRLSA